MTVRLALLLIVLAVGELLAQRGPGDRGPGDRGPGDRGPGDRGPSEPRSVDTRTFDTDSVGQMPTGFRFVETRDAAKGQWSVKRDDQNLLLVHAEDPTADRGIALALLERPPMRVLDVSVRLKLLTGRRAAGLIWRYQDPDNYYLAELALSEQSVGVYRMVNGNRVRIEDESDLELDPTAWHTLRVAQRRETARVYLGGIRVFEVRDRTFREAGAVGLWCSGDVLASFDDLRVEERFD